MRKPISAQDAEALSEAPPLDIDAAFLRKFYAGHRLLGRKSFVDALPPTTDSPGETRDKAKRYLDKLLPPDQVSSMLDRTLAAVEEHRDWNAELLGDFPRKLKKWAIFVLHEHAEAIAEMPFAAFRLDDVNASAVPLPSGATGIIINTSFLTVIPLVTSLFFRLYDDGTREPGIFRVSSGPQTTAFLRLVEAFARETPDDVPAIYKSVEWDLDIQMTMYVALVAVLHECAHVLLGHFQPTGEGSRGEEISPAYSRLREFEADRFATEHLLHLDSVVTKKHAFDVAAAWNIFLGFSQLVANVSSSKSLMHPDPTYRWTQIRSLVVPVFGDEVVVKRFEGIIEALASFQRLRLDDGGPPHA